MKLRRSRFRGIRTLQLTLRLGQARLTIAPLAAPDPWAHPAPAFDLVVVSALSLQASRISTATKPEPFTLFADAKVRNQYQFETLHPL